MTVDGPFDVDRRTLLKSLGASTVVGLAGCSEFTSRYYAAVPVVLPQETQTALGYEQVTRERMIEEREASAGPLDADLTVESYVFSFRPDTPSDLTTTWPRATSPPVGILATPRIEEVDQPLNPLVAMSLADLFTNSRGADFLARAGIIDDSDREVEWRVEPVRVDSKPTAAGIFEDEATVERYIGVLAESDSRDRVVFVDAVRGTRGSDEVLAAAGEQRALMAREDDAIAGSECESINCLNEQLEFEEMTSVVETILETVVPCPAFDGVDASDRSGVDLDDCVNVSGDGDSIDFLHLDVADLRLVQRVEDTTVEQSGGSPSYSEPDPDLVAGQNTALVFDIGTDDSGSPMSQWNTSVRVDVERRYADGSTAADHFFVPNFEARQLIGGDDPRAIFHDLARDGNSASDPLIFAVSSDLESVNVSISAKDDRGWSVIGDDRTIEASAGDFEVTDLRPLRVGFVVLLDADRGARYGDSSGGVRALARSFESATEYLQRVYPSDVVTYLHTDAGIVGNHERSGLFVTNCQGDCVIYEDMRWAKQYLDNEATSGAFPTNGTLRLDGHNQSSIVNEIGRNGFDVVVAIVPGIATQNSDASDYYDYFGKSASGLAFGDPSAAVSAEGAAPRGDDQPYSSTVAQEIGHYFQDDYRNPSGHPMAQRDDEGGGNITVNGVPIDEAHARHQGSDLRDRDTDGDGNNEVNNPPDPPGVVSFAYDLESKFTNVQRFENPNGSFGVDGPTGSSSPVGQMLSYMSYGRSDRSWTDARIHQQLIDSGWNAPGTSGSGGASYMLSATGGVSAEGEVQYAEVAAMPGFDEYTDREDGPVTVELLDPDDQVLASARVPLEVSATHGDGDPVTAPSFSLPFADRGVRVRTRFDDRPSSFNPVVRSVGDAVGRVPAAGVRAEPATVQDDVDTPLSEVGAAMEQGAYGRAADVMDGPVRERIQEEVVAYDAALNQPTRADLLALVDEMVRRLRQLAEAGAEG